MFLAATTFCIAAVGQLANAARVSPFFAFAFVIALFAYRYFGARRAGVVATFYSGKVSPTDSPNRRLFFDGCAWIVLISFCLGALIASFRWYAE
jgi:hypothetical protein